LEIERPNIAHVRPVRQVLTDGIYEALKEQLMDLTIRPGSVMNMARLAKELDVSTTPLREALARLESEGLITKKALQGYRAAPVLDEAGVGELFELRLALEPLAASKAATLRSEKDLADIETSVTNMTSMTATNTLTGHYQQYRAFADEDARFHNIVGRASRNVLLLRTMAGLNAHIHLYRLYFAAGIGNETALEHARIQAAIRDADARAAKRAMHEHLDNAWQRLRAKLSQELTG
jgi:DNA-binding GntR family transcriptional regulator